MPISVGNSTVNTSLSNSTITTNQTQSLVYKSSNRNSIRPSLSLDFARSKTVDPRITFIRTSSATYFNSLGVLTTAASNVPRIDFDPVTGACRGLLVEPTSTNVLYNSGATGAVAGTPGTNPTNWNIGAVFGSTGLSTSIIGTGSESGIPYGDVRFFGTPTSNGNGQRIIFTSSPGTVTGAQLWSGSVYCTLVGGSVTNINYFLLEVFSGNPTFNGNSTKTFTPTLSALNNSRVSTTFTLPTGSTIVNMNVVMGYTINLPIDVTIRIAAPQLELFSFTTSFITTPSAATALRAADSAQLSVGSWYNANAGTLVAAFYNNQLNGSFAFNWAIAGFYGSSNNNNLIDLFAGSGSAPVFRVQYGGVNQAYVIASGGPYQYQSNNKVAASWGTNGFFEMVNGNSSYSGSGSVGTIPTVSYLDIGTRWSGGVVPGVTWIRTVSYYPQQLSNAEMKTLTTDY